MPNEIETIPGSSPSWQDEMTQLLREPILADEMTQLLREPILANEGATREGESIGLSVSSRPSSEQQKVELFVSLYALHRAPPRGEEIEADQAALEVCLEEIQDADHYVRMAACQSLGQLGNPAAKTALQSALQDENRYVRAVAERALSSLEAPRVQAEDLTNVRLVVWQQREHLWKLLGSVKTDHRGQACLRNLALSADDVCRLRWLAPQQHEVGSLSLPALPSGLLGAASFKGARAGKMAAQGRMAAQDAKQKKSPLPQSLRLELEDGSVTCTLYQNRKKQIAVEFRSNVPREKYSGVDLTVVNKETNEEVLNEPVLFVPDSRGVLIGDFVLSAILDPSQEYNLYFSLLSIPE